MIVLRNVKRMPLENQGTDTYTECPFWLENDETAHALVMTDSSFGPFVPNGSVVYLTRRREPVPGDIIVVDLKNGSVFMRYLDKVTDDGMDFISLPELKLVRKHVKFSDIEYFAIVAGTRRI